MKRVEVTQHVPMKRRFKGWPEIWNLKIKQERFLQRGQLIPASYSRTAISTAKPHIHEAKIIVKVKINT